MITDAEYIKIARDEYGMAVRDNSREDLIAMGKEIEHGGATND